jgi:uncharacterized protein YgiM (DUF1202 family)
MRRTLLWIVLAVVLGITAFLAASPQTTAFAGALSFPNHLSAAPESAQPAFVHLRPVAQDQNLEPVIALPGRLRKAVNQNFDNYLIANDGEVYALVGKTPEVEAQIVAFREMGPDTVVKVWGTLYPEGRSSSTPEIVADSVILDTETVLPTATPSPNVTPTPTATNTPTATPLPTATPTPSAPTITVRYDTVNVRSGPSTAYPVVGTLRLDDTCPILGRDRNFTWWLVQCGARTAGWVSNDVVFVNGSTANVPYVPVAPPPPTPTPPAPPPTPIPTFTPPPPPPPSIPTNAWLASYFNNINLAGDATLVRSEPRGQYPLDQNWGTGSPAPGIIGNDNWSARWQGIYYFEAGDYTFTGDSDDGIRVYIDGIRILDGWYDGGKQISNRFNGIGAGNHQITVEFYEHTGNASVRVSWYRETSGGGGSGGGRHPRDE